MQKKGEGSIPAGPAFKEMTGFHRGETPEAQPDSYKTGCLAMSISAKHNSSQNVKPVKAVDTEPMQYK